MPGADGKLNLLSGPLKFDPITEASRQWDAHWESSATPAMAAVTSIMRAQQILMARLNSLLATDALTFPRYEALMVLYYSRSGELPLGKISDRLQVHRASVTNVVDKLVDQGYAERVSDDHDRRTVLAHITPSGTRAARRATRRLNDAGFGTSPLDASDCDQLSALLRPLRLHAGDFIAE